MSYYVEPKHRQEVSQIKARLKGIGWSVVDPNSDYFLLNSGPIHTRQEADELYKKWSKLTNPHGF